MQSHRRSEFDVSRIRAPPRRVTPPWNVYMAKFDSGWEGYPVWQSGLPALAGHPTYHVNVIKLKWENIWTGGLPQLSRLPHLPGAPPQPHADKKIGLFVTLSIVYIQILNTYLLEFLIARLMTLTESAAPVSQQVKGSNPVQAWIFFLLPFRNCIICLYNCDDPPPNNSSGSALHIYDFHIFIISYTIITVIWQERIKGTEKASSMHTLFHR